MVGHLDDVNQPALSQAFHRRLIEAPFVRQTLVVPFYRPTCVFLRSVFTVTKRGKGSPLGQTRLG